MAATEKTIRRRIALGAGLIALAGGLAGCAQPTQLERSSLSQSASPEQAMAFPPPGGPAVIGVVERRYSNALQHEVILAADSSVPGQNMLRIQMFGPVGVEGGDSALVDRQLADSGIAREMRSLIPGVAMSRSPFYAQNAYGPFGYAVGRHGGDLCLYGWQRIATAQVGSPVSSRGTIQVRLRLCQSGASEQSLLAVMYGYTINASFSPPGWNPFGAPPPVDPRLGSAGQAIYPAGPMGHAEVVAAPAAIAPAPAARRPAPARPAPAPAVDSPPPGAPLVPPPPGMQADEPAPVVPPPPTIQ